MINQGSRVVSRTSGKYDVYENRRNAIWLTKKQIIPFKNIINAMIEKLGTKDAAKNKLEISWNVFYGCINNDRLSKNMAEKILKQFKNIQ